MKKIIAIVLLMFSQSGWSQERLDALLDGLHQDAHEGNFQSYFNRYSSDAIFLGTDKAERWTIEEFKAYAKPAFEDGHGWTCLLYTSPSPRDATLSRMPSSA